MNDFNATLARRAAEQEHNKSMHAIQGAHRDAMTAVYKHPTMTADEKKAAVTKNMEQYCSAMKDWHCKNIDLGKKDDSSDYNMPYGAMSGSGPEETKEGRVISRSNLTKLKAAVGMIEEAKTMLNDGAVMLKEMGAAVEANAATLPPSSPGTGTEHVEVPGTGKAEDFSDIFKKALTDKKED